MLSCTLLPSGTPCEPPATEPDRADPLGDRLSAVARGEIGGRGPAADGEPADEPTLEQVLAAYWQATAPTQPGPLGGWAAYLAPDQVGAPDLDGYWTSTAGRPRLSPADAAAWTARIHHAAAREPLHLPPVAESPHPPHLGSRSLWRAGHRDPPIAAVLTASHPPDPAEDREPTPADLVGVAAELPTLLGELATALLAELPEQAEAITAAADLHRLAADLWQGEPPLPDSTIETTSERNPTMTLPAPFDPMVSPLPGDFPVDPSNRSPHSTAARGTPAEPDPVLESPPAESARRRHTFTPAEDARITQAVAAAASRQLGTALAALAAQLGLTFVQVQYRAQCLTRQARAGEQPVAAGIAEALEPAVLVRVEPPRPAGTTGDASETVSSPPADDSSSTRAAGDPVGGPNLQLAPAPGTQDRALGGHPGVPLTGRGEFVIETGGRVVAVITLEVADLGALVGGGLLRLPL